MAARRAAKFMFMATLLGSASIAAAPADTQPPGPDAPVTVDTIVVTAQKRTQSLQDVPIVVTTINRALLLDTGVKDIKDLTLLTPGMLVTTTSNESSTTARIRGIGTVGDNIGLESSVGVVIDGVYRPRNGVGFGDLGDVDRIEVLKGPQGTLFGKSTSAGVINVITAKPSFDFGGTAEFTAGNYNAVGGSASVTGALVPDKVAGSLFFTDRQRDGFYSVVTGQGPRSRTDDQNLNYFSLRGQILALPNDRTTIRLIADYSHRDESCCVGVVDYQGVTGPIVAGLGGAGGGEPLTPDPYNRTAYANRDSTYNVVDEGISAQVDYKLSGIDAAITSITAYRHWKSLIGQDSDFTNADILYRPAYGGNGDEFNDFSQELRFAGTYENLDYLVGGFYSNEALKSNYSLRYGSQFQDYLSLLFTSGGTTQFLRNFFGPNATYKEGDGSIDRYDQTDNSYAVFTNETLHITDALDFTVGLRFTEDEKSLNTVSHNAGNGGQACGVVNASPLVKLIPALQQVVDITCLGFENPSYNNFTDHQSSSEGELSGTAKLSYRFTPELLAYASYARGDKAGGFNLDRVACPNAPGCKQGSLAPVTDTFFPAEIADSYEVGAKSTLFHRTLILNATLFYQRFSDFQLNTFTGLVFVVDSVPTVTSKGVDADFVWYPTADLSFQGGVTVADTRFTDGDQASLSGNGQQFLGAPGSRLPLAPLFSASLSGTYSRDLAAGLVGRFTAGAKYSSSYNTGSDLDPRKEQKAFALVNARVAVGPEDERYSVELWAENLFDQHYEQVAFDAPFQGAPNNAKGVIDAFLGQPRTFGATLRVKF
jgi:outer membrane receptor protein involved in Fe transport